MEISSSIFLRDTGNVCKHNFLTIKKDKLLIIKEDIKIIRVR